MAAADQSKPAAPQLADRPAKDELETALAAAAEACDQQDDDDDIAADDVGASRLSQEIDREAATPGDD